MKFDLTKIENNEQYKDRFSPGIWEVEILSLSLKENQNNKPYVSVVVTDLTGTMEHEERLFVTTSGAINVTMKKIKELYEATRGKDQFPKEEVAIEVFNDHLAGRKLRIKLVGDEYVSNDTVYVRPGFPYRNFAENINVNRESSRLRFDENRDITRLPKQEAAKEPLKEGAPTNLEF